MTERFGTAARIRVEERLDQALMRPPFNLSRRGAKRVMDEGRIVVDGAVVAVASRRIAAGARIALIEQNAALPLLARGADFVVIDKPALLPAQIPADQDALAAPEILTAQLRREGERREVKVVHRLDTNTTGVMLYALGDAAAARLASKIQSSASTKRYLALVAGRLPEERMIDAPIGRSGPREFGVRDDGRPARTRVRPLEATDDATLIEAELLTGRTHQIRVHLTWAGHPILGDHKYGSGVADAAARPMLHAWKLELEGEGRWSAPLPPDLLEALDKRGMQWNAAAD